MTTFQNKMSAFTMYEYSCGLPYYHIGFWRALLISEWRTMAIRYKLPLVATLEISVHQVYVILNPRFYVV